MNAEGVEVNAETDPRESVKRAALKSFMFKIFVAKE